MFKNFVVLMFVGMILTVSVTASATSNEPAQNTNSSLEIANVATAGNAPMQTASVGSSDAPAFVSQGKNETEFTLPATGWLLFAALIGFVLMSNRWGV